MTPAPVLTFRAGALDREVVLLGQDRVGEILTYRGGRAEYSVHFGETLRRRTKANGLESARNIVALLVGDTLQRMGLLERGQQVRTEIVKAEELQKSR